MKCIWIRSDDLFITDTSPQPQTLHSQVHGSPNVYCILKCSQVSTCQLYCDCACRARPSSYIFSCLLYSSFFCEILWTPLITCTKNVPKTIFISLFLFICLNEGCYRMNDVHHRPEVWAHPWSSKKDTMMKEHFGIYFSFKGPIS